jgi:hypothetical protein
MVAATCASAVNDTFEVARRAEGVGGGRSRGQQEATGRIGRSVGSVDIGCLLVDAVGLTMDNYRELLRDVSFAARPGSLNAIIGPLAQASRRWPKWSRPPITPRPAKRGR